MVVHHRPHLPLIQLNSTKMALTPEERQIVEFGKAQGKSKEEVINALAKYRAPSMGTTGQPSKPNFWERTKQAFSSGVSKMGQAFQESQAGRNPLSTGAKLGAGAVETVFSPLTAAAQPIIEPTLGKAIKYGVEKISD